jgi:hypothetical protein
VHLITYRLFAHYPLDRGASEAYEGKHVKLIKAKELANSRKRHWRLSDLTRAMQTLEPSKL